MAWEVVPRGSSRNLPLAGERIILVVGPQNFAVSRHEGQNRMRDSSDRRSVILIAYMAHLLVPLFLLLDVLWADRNGFAGRGSKVVMALSELWLAIGFGAFLLIRNRAQFLYRLLISIYALFLSLVLLELFARGFLWTLPKTLHKPGIQFVLQPDPTLIPGIEGSARFTVNEVGLRGPSLQRGSSGYKIVAVGGSTTECANLDDSETWTHLLMVEMNSRQKRYSVWIANAGVSGHTTVEHLTLLQILPVLSQVDALIFLVGANDLHATLSSEGAPTQRGLAARAAWLRESILAGENLAGGKPPAPFFKRLELYALSRKAALNLISRFTNYGIRMGMTGQVSLAEYRRYRAEGSTIPLPDLQTGLKEYSERVLRIGHECQVRGVRCIFVTQPTLWRNDLTAAEERLLWMGWVGHWPGARGYLAAADAALAMDAYNRTLVILCRVNGLECYDLASSMPRDTSVFYDDFHFTKAGARMVARLLSDYLLSTPTFRDIQ